MYCTQCGTQVRSFDRFCSACGAAQSPDATPVAARRLVRPRASRKISGVSQGFANYLDVDVTLVRFLWVILTLLSGGLVVVGYIVAWIVMPEETAEAVSTRKDGYAPAPVPAPPAAQPKV